MKTLPHSIILASVLLLQTSLAWPANLPILARTADTETTPQDASIPDLENNDTHPPGGPFPASQLYQNSWAVIIGIDDYTIADKLDYAVQDAIAVKECLVESMGFPSERISILLNADATKEGIVTVLDRVSTDSGREDRVVVFFAGHGETEVLPTGGEMGYLVPVNGDPSRLYLTCIPMQELRVISERNPAKHLLFLVDACYGGLAAVQERRSHPLSGGRDYIRKMALARVRQIITAGGRDEPVIERDEWGHSAFTYKLTEALRAGLADLDGDGFITATELGTHLKESVSRMTAGQQTPVFRFLSYDEGDFIFYQGEAMLPAFVAVDSEIELSSRRQAVGAGQSTLVLPEEDASNEEEMSSKSAHVGLLSTTRSVQDAGFVPVDETPHDVTALSAALRSAAIPGWGQFYSRRKRAGGMYLLGEIALVTAATFAHLEYEREQDRYYESGDPGLHDDVKDAWNVRNGAVGLAIALWAWNVVDAYVFR